MSDIVCNPYLPHRRDTGRSWIEGEIFATRANRQRSHRKFNKLWGYDATFATLNVRNLGRERPDSDFNFSYLKTLAHDATGLTEMWNTHRHYESWDCVTSETNTTGRDRPSGACIMLSKRFASRQMNRG